MKTLAAVLLALAATAAHADDLKWGEDGTHHFFGYAYDLKSNKYLYTEIHEQKVAKGKWQGGSIKYIAANGKSIGSKTLDFSADPTVPLYRLDSPQDGYVEGITANGNTVTMVRRDKTGAKEETGSIPKQGPMAADSGFHSFLVEHFSELLKGQTVKFRFVAAGRLDTFKFKAHRIADTTFEGKPAVRFLVEMDSMLNLLAGPLEVTYDPEVKRLVEYKGMSNVHDPATGDAFEQVRISYYTKPPADAPKLPN